MTQRTIPTVRQSARGRVWSGLAQRLAQSGPLPAPRPTPGIWAALQSGIDPLQYRPQSLPDIVAEQINDGVDNYIVLRSPAGTYMGISPTEYHLLQRMDGTRSVSQLVLLGFNECKQLVPVDDLVQKLKQQRFLSDPPVNLYQRLRAADEEDGVEGWGQRVLAFLKGHTFAINGIDSFYSALYRSIGWICFTPPFLIFHALVGLAGVVAFLLALNRPSSTYQVLEAGNVPVSLLTLWGLALLSFALHESAHALAVKHYGRVVRRGGVMIYYGMPAAFVDTSDIWLAGQKARIVVSLAGPLADLLLGGLASLLAFAFPAHPLSPIAYKLAFACYVTTLFNANPLLELDGYFVLVDWLRLPNLRRRALAFVSGPLWQKIAVRVRQADRERPPPDGARSWLHNWFVLLPFSKEERIFTLYGVLTALYTGLAIVLAGMFWQQQLVKVISQLWESGPLGKLLAVLIVGAVVIPICLGLLLAAWGLVQSGAAWIERRGYGRRPLLVAVALLVLTGLLALLPLRFEGTNERQSLLTYGPIATLLWSVALVALAAIRADYRGADVKKAIDGLLAANALTLLTMVGRMVYPPLAPIWTVLDLAAFLLFMVAGFVALLDVDLHQASSRELALTAFLLVAAFAFSGAALYQAQSSMPGAPFALVLLMAAPVYCGALALALLLPHLMGLRDSRLLWCWLLVWVGIGVQTTAYVLTLLPTIETPPAAFALNIFAAGCWATAWSVHYVTLRGISPEDMPWPNEALRSEGERLQRAFQHTYAGCYRLLRAVYGARRAQSLDDRMDVLAATANWDVTLDHDRARISPALAALTLDAQGVRYAEVLRYTVATIEEFAGASFARRVIQAAYDALPWPERETANRLCFPNTPWANELSQSFGSARAARLRLLRQVDLFAACDDDELDELAAALQPQRFLAGQEVLAQSKSAAGIWIIEAGEVVVWEGRQIVEELHRVDCFGAPLQAPNGQDPKLKTQKLEPRSYRTTVASTLLFLPTAEFQRLLAAEAPHAAEGLEAIQTLRLLERVPLFADVPRHTLRGLAHVALRQTFAARSILVRQGEPNGVFYIIKEGRVAVVARGQGQSNGATTSGAARVIAQLGPEEFFGELELLHGTPPVASIVSTEPVVLLALPHDAIAALLAGSTQIARGLEQVGTGRLIDLRSQTVEQGYRI